ncbi:MAG: nucleotidyl transferase AbiEii/AbiGii toxin family protein [Anaerolineales bacterium]
MATLAQELRHVLEESDPQAPNETRRILLKSALQGYVLAYLYNHRWYRDLNFYGGTCLRVIFGINRLSEDIDLDNTKEVNLDQIASDLLEYFQGHLGYQQISLHKQEGEMGIMRITLKFPLLYELELTPHHDEKLHLKVEISHHRQVSVVKRTPVIYQGRSFVATHHTKETMMAGKMLACLERSFQKGDTATKIKGRDYYDLIWFMRQRIQPLAEKLAKDGSRSYTIQDALKALEKRVSYITKQDLRVDLYPLFENRVFIESWIDSFHENFMEYVRYYRTGGV